MAENRNEVRRQAPPPGPRGAGMLAPKTKLKKGTIRRFLSYFAPYKGRMLLVLCCIIISAFVTSRGSVFIRDLIDNYIMPLLGKTDPDFSALLRRILQMAAIYAVGIVSTFTFQRVMAITAQRILKDVRDDMFTHMQTLPIRYFDTHTYGDVMSKYTNDNDTLRQMITMSLPQMVNSAISLVVVFFTMLSQSVVMTVIVLVTSSSMVFITKKVAGSATKYFVGQQKSLGDVNGYVEEMINGQRVVKVFNHEQACKEEFDRRNEELFENSNRANRIATSLMPIMANMGNFQYVFLAVIGGIFAINNVFGITLGTVAAFLILSRSFTMPISQVSQQVNAVIMALAGMERIYDLLDEPSEEDHGTVTLVNVKYEGNDLAETDEHTSIWAWKVPQSDGTFQYTRLQGDVRFDDVDFGYSPDKTVLHNISLFAKPGQKVAFVGATGAGKTTITNLINRFYDIADGKIHYDGISINDIKKTDLRHSLGIVLQDVNLFTGTVMENIRYGRLDATDEECIAAAELANAHDFIMRLPQGYDTMIEGDGGRLSQGQRQLLSIARAAVADPPVMILDEATSSIDTRTEALVQQGMDALMSGRTVFVIAHRLSTVQNADVILVLDHGRIIERGNHEQLIAEKGKYYQLYTGAFELE
ncbi:MAG: ABC transporter ATP-binding protein [Oscillospiraceae bacterium]|nr:ABC transporter ATP-binding protein [Oscillospiraceae bacterium]MBR6430995.1 ABC transporter ATP-binding protein [Oscillospiraceae bacterium]